MKRIKTIIKVLACSLLFTSCYDLNKYPADKLNSDAFWKTESQAKQAIVGAYSQLINENVYGCFFGLECLSDVAMGYDTWAYDAIFLGRSTDRYSLIVNKYQALYEGIARTNLFLQNINSVDMNEELMNQYIGEAHFLRALYYFELLDYWGGVPLYDESTVVVDEFNTMLKGRSSAEETRNFILSDLNIALVNLPEKWADSDYGRATKSAALALKGKTYLYNKQYSEAADCFELIVDSKLHKLYDGGYANIFKPEGDSSSEMIFSTQCVGGVGMDYGIPSTKYLGTRASYGSDWNNVMVSTDFVDTYEWKDGKPFNWDDVIPNYNEDASVREATFNAQLSADLKTVTKYPEAKNTLLNMYSQRDPRLTESIILPYTKYNGWVSNAPKECEYVIATGVNENNGMIRPNANKQPYLWRKFVAEGNMGGLLNNREDTPINFPIIRYADVLLMLAECSNELGDLDQAVSLINEVRARKGVDMPGLNSGPTWLEARTKEDVFNRIKHERAIEFAVEGIRFSDLKRWGELEKLNGKKEYNLKRTVVDYTHIVNPRDYLWPIPAVEMEINPTLKEQQNPGW